MKTTFTLIKLTLKMFLRNRQAIYLTLVMPFLIMVVFSLVGFDRPVKYDVGIAVTDAQPQTRQFIDRLGSVAVFKLHEAPLTDEIKELREGNRTVVLRIPGDFMEHAGQGTQKLTVYINDTQAAQAQAILSILTQYLDKTSLALAHAPDYFTVIQQHVDSRNLSYTDFLLPGLVAMSVMQMSVFSVAFLFTQYKEKGMLKRLVATPMRPEQFVAANSVARLIVSVIQAAIFIAGGVLIMHAHVQGSYLLVLLAVTLGTLMFLGLGFTISGVSKTVESVPVLANLIAFPMLFLGGTFFPISGMPSWLQAVVKFLPLTFFNNALRDVMTKAATLGAIKWDLVGMALWSAVLIAAATVSFSFSEREQ